VKAYVDGIGLLAPGLAGWRAARAVLAGSVRYEPGEMPRPAAEILPPAERRRCGDLVKLALHVGGEALAPSGARAEDLATVFTCATGNGEVLHQICETLAGSARDVSPTRFHNSVHNAPAGYWSIATGARTASTSLCAHQGSFAAGLVEAAVQVRAEHRPVLLVAYDLPPPPPLAAVVPCTAPFGLALVLAPSPGAATLGALELELAGAGAETTLDDPALERLRTANAAARALPVLAALAAGRTAAATLEWLPDLWLAVSAAPHGAG
jgi:Beta-ketoacyl synthase, N-terminal domain